MTTYLLSSPKLSLSHILSLVLQLVVGTVFLLAAARKVSSPRRFTRAITDYRIFPLAVVEALTWLIILAEFSTGFILIVSPYVPGALLFAADAAAAGLFVCFATGMIVNLRRGRAISCGCGTSAAGSDTVISWRRATESVVIALAILASVCVPQFGPARIGSSGIVVAVVTFFCVTLTQLYLAVRRSGLGRMDQKILVERVKRMRRPKEVVMNLEIS